MLLHVLQSFYFALGGFASSTLASLVRGSILLVRETSIAVRVISERAASVRARARLQ